MTLLTGIVAPSPLGGAQTPQISAQLRAYAVDDWPTHQAAMGATPAGALVSQLPVSAAPRALAAVLAPSYVLDFYDRIHITPTELALGNLTATQQRTVRVWNAWRSRPVTLNDITLSDGSLSISGQGAPPFAIAPLQELAWQLSIGLNGAPTVDNTAMWVFAGDPSAQVHITGNRVTAWGFAPNWANGITERLEWLTLVERGTSGQELATPLREYPRRSWEYPVLAHARDRQRMEAMLYDASARTWAVPVWPDQQTLAADLPSGATVIPASTAGLDFAADGLAMLWRDAQTLEVVQIASVAADSLTLVRPTQSGWAAGTRLYPARTARLDSWPNLSRYTTQLVGGSVRFVGADASDWPAQMPATTYRGTPVLEDAPEWSQAPAAQYARDVERLESATGVVELDDVTGLPWPTQSHRWQIYGRAARDTLRKRLYALAGRAGRLWVPTWQDDLTPLAALASGATTLDVAHCAYTVYLHGQNGRRDLRVELVDGTVLYRRITASAELDADTERLAVDSAWGVDATPEAIARISFMGLCRLNADAVEIQHLNDSEGVAVCAVTFAQVTADG